MQRLTTTIEHPDRRMLFQVEIDYSLHPGCRDSYSGGAWTPGEGAEIDIEWVKVLLVQVEYPVLGKWIGKYSTVRQDDFSAACWRQYVRTELAAELEDACRKDANLVTA